MRARGFSLIEVVVAMAASLIVVAAGVALLRASQRSFEVGSDERGLQESARVAMEETLTNLRSAGYGLEPTFALDPGVIAPTVMDRVPLGVQARFGGFCGDGVYNADGACPRDSITGPDQLVFYSRDPRFARDVTGVGASSLTLSSAADLSKGQILQIMCYGTNSQWLWAYVTVDGSTLDKGIPTVTLQSGPGKSYDFPFQQALLNENSCFQSGTVRAFKIDTYRYFVEAVDPAGVVQPWGTPGTRPYLMLDRNLSVNDKPIHEAIAPDVEDLQIAYVFPLAPASAQTLGATPKQLVTVDSAGGSDAGFNLAPALGIPSFKTPSLDPLRTTHHPANIRAIRIAITVRTPRHDPAVPDAAVPAALNRPDVDGEAGYRRAVFESTVYVHNLENRLAVFPTYDANVGSSNPCCPSAAYCKEKGIQCTCNGNCGGG